jgi:Raf kinase inhibitor-like YbhB/YbcL family protein
MKCAAEAVVALAVALAGSAALAQEAPMKTAFTVSSPAFEDGRPIPTRHSADGVDISPPLTLANPPEGTESFALIMDDPDAPMGTWVHWVVWNIPGDTRTIPAGSLPDRAVEGRNSWGRAEYGGPAPPSGTHRYFFKVYAVDTTLDLRPTIGKAELERAMQGHVLAEAALMGMYTRGG